MLPWLASRLAHGLAIPLLLALPTLTAAARTQNPPPTPTLTLPAFTGYAHPDPDAIERNTTDGSVPRCTGELAFYIHIATPGSLELTLARLAGAPAVPLRVQCFRHPGDNAATATAQLPAAKTAARFPLGSFTLHEPGMYRLVLAAIDGKPLRQLAALELSGPAILGAHASTVERRNASSVHLGYDVPAAHRDDVTWFYLELSARTDPLWTYYMATGWQRGYFGMQVNSASERRVIFSVWDAGDEAIDRSKVTADDRVQLLAKGPDVLAEGFGHEGTGGHSHVVHDWRTGETCRFLLHAERDGTHTTYTGWYRFGDEPTWTLVASFRAPKDGQLLHGLYSFSENFSGANGDALRDCEFGNGWIRTTAAEWLPLRAARFTHDDHGDRLRLDHSAGVRGKRFYLQHGGFLLASLRGGTRVELPGDTVSGKPPTDAELPTPPVATPSSDRR